MPQIPLILFADPADYYAACRVSFRPYVTLYLLSPTLTSLGYTTGLPTRILAGSVTADAGTSPRWQASVTVAAASLPPGVKDTLAFGGQFAIDHAIYSEYAHAACTATVANGYVRSVTTDRPDGTITLDLAGYEGRLTEDIVTATVKATPTDSVVDVIEFLIRRTFDAPPFLTIAHGSGLDTATVIGDGYTIAPGDNPLQHCLDLAKTIGAEVFCLPDDLGQAHWRIQDVAGAGDYAADAAYTTPETTMLRSRSTVRRAVNRTRLRFEPAKPTTAKPARTGAAEVTTGPQDPDTMGRVTEFQRRTGYRTAAVANTAAARLLTQRSRRTRAVSWEQVPCPWLAPGDTVPVRTVPLEEDPAGVESDLVVNRFVLPLVADTPMTVVARETSYIEA